MKKIIIIILISAFFVLPVKAEYNHLPEPIVGQTTVTQNINNYYGGVTGNETVFNSTKTGQNGPDDDLFGFDKDNLLRCVTIISGFPCFTPNFSTSIKIMTSRTYYNSVLPSYEIAALSYPSKTVVGDVYGSLSNFAFWGKNLHQVGTGSTNSDASWQTSDYPINTNAQASLDPNGTEYKKYVSKITQMTGEAITADTSPATWYLQSPTLLNNSSSDRDKYPEGKIWKTGTINLSGSRTYCGVGTIIVEGDLLFNPDADFKPIPTSPACPKNRLGFIITGKGNVTISGGNDIQASIFSLGNITVNGNNNILTGSFVAQNFNGMGGSNIRFYYDYDLDSSWPPGFRYLNMPHAGETKQ